MTNHYDTDITLEALRNEVNALREENARLSKKEEWKHTAKGYEKQFGAVLALIKPIAVADNVGRAEEMFNIILTGQRWTFKSTVPYKTLPTAKHGVLVYLKKLVGRERGE